MADTWCATASWNAPCWARILEVVGIAVVAWQRLSGLQRADHDEVLGVHDRQGAEQKGIDDREDRRRGAGAERQAQDRRRGESLGAQEPPSRVPKVLAHATEELPALSAPIPSAVVYPESRVNLSDVAESIARRSRSRVDGHPLRFEVLGPHVEVECQLIADVGIDVRSPKS